MGQLDQPTVDAAYNALKSRALAAIDTIVKKKTILGGYFGNNDTLDSDAGAIRTLVGIDDSGNPTAYGAVGNDAFDNWHTLGGQAVDDDSLVDRWVALGKTIESSIAAIDGYSDGATLDSVVHLTAQATSQQLKDDANDALIAASGFVWSALPWWAIAGIGVAALGVGFIYVRPLLK